MVNVAANILNIIVAGGLFGYFISVLRTLQGEAHPCPICHRLDSIRMPCVEPGQAEGQVVLDLRNTGVLVAEEIAEILARYGYLVIIVGRLTAPIQRQGDKDTDKKPCSYAGKSCPTSN